MSETCPTVKVVSVDSPDGFIVINASDQTDGHQLFSEDSGIAPDNSKLSVAKLRDALTAAGIEFDEKLPKAELLALLNAGKSE